MTLHKEGTGTLISIAIGLVILNLGIFALADLGTALYTAIALSLVLYALVLNFFRYIPLKHPLAERNDVVVCPADGKVVVIEEVDETQILGERCLQVSVFMNVFDKHVNWIPVNGTVEHSSHSEGRFMAAHLPKASTDNERSAVVIRTEDGHRVLVRQIAGAVARRIVTYSKEGDACRINENMGFIKFGSRVDLYMPLGTKVHVQLGQKVEGNITLIAELPKKD
ncbi:MAG: phosphatidylserine decarboxylase family protein [Porphyromonas sp.]|nr:phosphatidylserine decarboxylase family protein [Porphyromonas sp.]